jgi:hypothetical protein
VAFSSLLAVVTDRFDRRVLGCCTSNVRLRSVSSRSRSNVAGSTAACPTTTSTSTPARTPALSRTDSFALSRMASVDPLAAK